jgi:hypothetical protein
MHSRVLMMVAAFLFCSVANSECGIGYCRGIGAQVVQTATVTSTGVYFYLPSTATNAVLGCPLDQGYYVVLSNTNPSYKDIYATYLTAIATNQYFLISLDASCHVASIRTWNN